MEGLIFDGSKFTVFALFYFVFEGNFPSTSPRGAYTWRGDLTEGFLRYALGGLFSEFYGIFSNCVIPSSEEISRIAEKDPRSIF